MTSTQFLMGWAVYLAGASGCLLALVLITRTFGYRSRRTLWLTVAALLFTPWFLAQDSTMLTPALLTALFDLLSHGPESVSRAGLPVMITTGSALFLGLVLPVRKSSGQTTKESPPRAEKTKPKPVASTRKEPTV